MPWGRHCALPPNPPPAFFLHYITASIFGPSDPTMYLYRLYLSSSADLTSLCLSLYMFVCHTCTILDSSFLLASQNSMGWGAAPPPPIPFQLFWHHHIKKYQSIHQPFNPSMCLLVFVGLSGSLSSGSLSSMQCFVSLFPSQTRFFSSSYHRLCFWSLWSNYVIYLYRFYLIPYISLYFLLL